MHFVNPRTWLATLLVALMLLPTLTQAQGPFEDDLLDPDDAFSLSAEAIDTDTVRLNWDIADGYYMYRKQFEFTPESEGLELGEPQIPDGEIKDDEFFGRVETYRGQVQADLPITAAESTSIELTARSQGCADLGVCYPPHFQTVSVELPGLPGASDRAATDAATAGEPETERGALDELGELSAGPGAGEDLLEPDKAFAASIEAISQNAAILRFDIADGYYLYRDKLDVRVAEGEGIELGPVNPPEGETQEDEFFGASQVFRDRVEFLVPVLREADDVADITLAVDYQGCADAGVCYPPLTQEVSVTFAADLAAETDAEVPPAPEAATGEAAADSAPVTEQDRIAAQLADGQIWLVALVFFGFGLLLTFTPLRFPDDTNPVQHHYWPEESHHAQGIPDLAGVRARDGGDLHRRRGVRGPGRRQPAGSVPESLDHWHLCPHLHRAVDVDVRFL